MVDIQLFALHQHGDVQIGGSLPGIGSGDDESQFRDADGDAEESGSSKSTAIGVLALGTVLLVAALVAKRRVGGDESEEPETVPLAESDEMEATAD